MLNKIVSVSGLINPFQNKIVSCASQEWGFTYGLINPFLKDKIRFLHKTRSTLHLFFNNPFAKNKVRSLHKTMIRLYLCLNVWIR
jgi:hypothetical protein